MGLNDCLDVLISKKSFFFAYFFNMFNFNIELKQNLIWNLIDQEIDNQR